MFPSALIFAAYLSVATDSSPPPSVRQGKLGAASKPVTHILPVDSVRSPPPNAYLTTIPSAFWLSPGMGFSSNGYAANLGLNVSTRPGYFFSLQGTTSGNLRILNERFEYATSAAFLSGYRTPRSDLFATFALGPVYGKGETSWRTNEEKECGFLSFGCDGYSYQRRNHEGFGFMAQSQVGASNRFFGFTAQIQLITFDGLMAFGVLLGFPMGHLY